MATTAEKATPCCSANRGAAVGAAAKVKADPVLPVGNDWTVGQKRSAAAASSAVAAVIRPVEEPAISKAPPKGNSPLSSFSARVLFFPLNVC